MDNDMGGGSMPISPGTNRDFGNMLNEKIRTKKTATLPNINKKKPHFSPWTAMSIQSKDTVK